MSRMHVQVLCFGNASVINIQWPSSPESHMENPRGKDGSELSCTSPHNYCKLWKFMPSWREVTTQSLLMIVFDHVWSPPLYQRQYWFHTLATLLFYMDIQDSKCNILLVCVFDAILTGNRQSPHAGSRTSPTTARIIATFVDFAAVCRIIALCVPIPGPQRNSHSKAKLVTLAALS